MLPPLPSFLSFGNRFRRHSKPIREAANRESGCSMELGPYSETANGRWKRENSGIGIALLIAAPLAIMAAGYAAVLIEFKPDRSTPASRYHDTRMEPVNSTQEWLERERRQEQAELDETPAPSVP